MDDLEDTIYVDCMVTSHRVPVTDRETRDFDSRLLLPEFRRSISRRILSEDEIEVPEEKVRILRRNAKQKNITFVPGYTTKSGKKTKGYFRGL